MHRGSGLEVVQNPRDIPIIPGMVYILHVPNLVVAVFNTSIGTIDQAGVRAAIQQRHIVEAVTPSRVTLLPLRRWQ